MIRFNQDFDLNNACLRHVDLNMRLDSISCDKQTKKYSYHIFIQKFPFLHTISIKYVDLQENKKILEMNGNVVTAPCQKIQDLQNCECCTFSTLLL